MSYERPFNVYQDVHDEAMRDYDPEPDYDRPAARRPVKPWDGNPETAPDGPDEDQP